MMCGIFAVTALLLEDRQSRLEQEGEEDRWDMTYDAASPLPFGDETRVRTSLILARRSLLNETGMLDSVICLPSPHLTGQSVSATTIGFAYLVTRDS